MLLNKLENKILRVNILLYFFEGPGEPLNDVFG